MDPVKLISGAVANTLALSIVFIMTFGQWDELCYFMLLLGVYNGVVIFNKAYDDWTENGFPKLDEVAIATAPTGLVLFDWIANRKKRKRRREFVAKHKWKEETAEKVVTQRRTTIKLVGVDD
jgi:hypothetical protein